MMHFIAALASPCAAKLQSLINMTNLPSSIPNKGECSAMWTFGSF